MRDQRKSPREGVQCTVRYATEDSPKRVFTTKSVDLSLGGIGMRLREFIRGNMVVKLKIYSHLSPAPISAEGKIMWQSGLPGFGASRAGVQFTDAPYTKIKGLLREAVT